MTIRITLKDRETPIILLRNIHYEISYMARKKKVKEIPCIIKGWPEHITLTLLQEGYNIQVN